MFKCILLLTVSIFLSGCASTYTPYQPKKNYSWEDRVDFNEDEYAAYGKAGTNSIRIQAFSKTVGGNIQFAAGETVYLVPATSYSDQSVDIIIKESKGADVGLRDKADKRVNSYVRTGICDANGRYTFNNVPDGSYYVYTPVFWGEFNLSGGWVYNKFSTKNSDLSNTIVVTKSGRSAASYSQLQKAGIEARIPYYKEVE